MDIGKYIWIQVNAFSNVKKKKKGCWEVGVPQGASWPEFSYKDQVQILKHNETALLLFFT